jgi:SAM-dependent methyltransferase
MLELCMLICPSCGAALETVPNQTAVCKCGEVYARLPSGGLDFLQGRAVRDFVLDPFDGTQGELLDLEAAGLAWLTEGYLLPLIRGYAKHTQLRNIRVLDCGCGAGIPVAILRAHGIEAEGIDNGRARQEQWTERSYREHLHSADPVNIPFAGRTFNIVFSSGLIEHIGVQSQDSGRFRRQVNCEALRLQFIKELVRVTKPRGFIMVDHPNGRFPIDFWHGRKPGGFRLHYPWKDMLPGFRDISRYFHLADPSLKLFCLPPGGKLQYSRVGPHWYGGQIPLAGKRWLKILEKPGFPWLVRSCLNPYLVTLATRDSLFPTWKAP